MKGKYRKKSIFSSLFFPIIIIMVIQAVIFYMAAVYGGIEKSLSQNAVDILSGSMNSRKNEIETAFNNKWTHLDECISALNEQYAEYEKTRGTDFLVSDVQNQVDFLESGGDILVDTLRYSETNGIFLILNDLPKGIKASYETGDQKYGLCIRDMDQESNYSGREDLLLERAPSSIVETIDCLLDSWWEAKYSFDSYEEGAYYYAPLEAAFKYSNSKSENLAFLSDSHRISGSDPMMISYSVPLFSKEGHPYAVLGVELSMSYLESLIPNKELNKKEQACYILAMREAGTDDYKPIIGSGILYNRCFSNLSSIKRGELQKTGGFYLSGKDNTKFYATEAVMQIYNNNNPFESRQLVLLAAVENKALFSYISNIKLLLFAMSALSLLLGVIALIIVSRSFSAPITALAKKARHIDEFDSNYKLEHLGVIEIDQLVDSIEELNLNVSRNSMRTEFFSRMSHDMRTPMNAIISFSSEELLENVDEATKDDYFRKIHDSGLYMLGLINEVLDMTKIEGSKTVIHFNKVYASHIFETSVNIIQKLAEKRRVNFNTHIDFPKDLMAMADEQHISQIVMNLLSNAVKFTPEGGAVDLSVDIYDGNFRIIVSDTGIGMSKEYMDKLYIPFSQENNNHEGTGLGLSISKKLIELMNGSIECQSQKNEGTVFTVLLPFIKTDDDTDTKPKEEKTQYPSDLSKLSGKRILVCEDNNINIGIIKLLLERVGIQADFALNGEQGVELFRKSRSGTYKAILMDIRMPVMNGHEASKSIRQLERKDAASIPIIAMTADAFLEDEEISKSAGMNAHLSKPIDIKKLYSTLMQYIK